MQASALSNTQCKTKVKWLTQCLKYNEAKVLGLQYSIHVALLTLR